MSKLSRKPINAGRKISEAEEFKQSLEDSFKLASNGSPELILEQAEIMLKQLKNEKLTDICKYYRVIVQEIVDKYKEQVKIKKENEKLKNKD